MRRAMSGWLKRRIERPRWVWVVFPVLFVGTAVAGRGAPERLTAGGFEVVDSEAARVAAAVERDFGVREPDIGAVVEPTDKPIAAELRATVAALADDPRVEEVRLLGDPDAIATRPCLITVALAGSRAQREAAFDHVATVLHQAAPAVRIGGALATQLHGQRLAEADLLRAELITLPAVACALLWFFRGWVAASLPLGLGAFSIASALALLSALSYVTTVSVSALNIVTFLGLGLAIDYALFMVQRFREELAAGKTPIESAQRTLNTAGRTVLYSGLAVTVCLLALLFFPIVLIRSVAVAGALVVTCTMLAAIIMLPPVMVSLASRIGRRAESAQKTGPWARMAAWVMVRPGMVAIVITSGLLALAWPGLRVQTAISDARIFPPGDEVRVFQTRVTEDPDLRALGSIRHVIVLSAQDLTSASSAGALYDTVAAYRAVEGVLALEALPIALGSPDRSAFIAQVSALAAAPEAQRLPLAQIWNGDRTLVLVGSDRRPGSSAASEQLAALRAATSPPLQVEIGGPIAAGDEVRSALRLRAIPSLVTVLGVMFVIILVGFAAVPVALKAIVMNVLSLGASFGVLVAVFQDGRFEQILHYESVGTIDPLVPILAGAIVFGLSMDYELFLLSRIKEEFDNTGDPIGSIATGLQRTAGLVTRAAVVLVLVLVGFASARVLFVKQIGVAMAMAVLLDATVVRALLVPASMRLMGRWNWWCPGTVLRWLQRLRLGIDER